VTTVCGNIATVPKHQITAKGQALTSFRLASTPRKFDQDVQGYVDGETTWVNVTCWGALAFNASKSLQKGQPVTVHGSLRHREWVSDDGKSGKDLELSALTIGHDLRRGCADFQKVGRGPGAERRFGPRQMEAVQPGSVDVAGNGLDDHGVDDHGLDDHGLGDHRLDQAVDHGLDEHALDDSNLTGSDQLARSA
jgi:single-strand DNA-binding protein